MDNNNKIEQNKLLRYLPKTNINSINSINNINSIINPIYNTNIHNDIPITTYEQLHRFIEL